MRSFDCGTYLGRPNTLGLVAVWFSPNQPGDRPIWQQLAALRPPVPGNEQYQLAMPSGETKCDAPSLQAFRRWEEQRRGGIPCEPIVFGAGETLPPGGEAKRRTKHWKIGSAIGLASVAVLAGMIGLFWADPAGKLPPQDHLDLSPQQRELLVEQLRAAGVPLKNPADLRSLVTLALRSENAVRSRVQKLRDGLDRQGRENTPSQLQGLIKDLTDNWSEPVVLSAESDVSQPLSAARRDAAISLMEQYYDLTSIADQIVNKDVAGGELFQQDLKALEKTLADNSPSVEVDGGPK
jgi:hypothetical protein